MHDPDNASHPLMTAVEVGQLFRFKAQNKHRVTRRIAKMVREGIIPPEAVVDLGNNRRLYRRAVLLRWIGGD